MENDFLSALQRLVPVTSEFLATSIGHDGAWVIPGPKSGWYVSTDCQVEGIHYRKGWQTAQQRGRKLAASALADLWATGCSPKLAFLNLDLPKGVTPKIFEAFCEGLGQVFSWGGVALGGGNLSGSIEGWHAHLMVMGEPGENGPLLRQTGNIGDWLLVGGQPGLAHLGLLALSEAVPVEPRLEIALQAFCDPWQRLKSVVPLPLHIQPTSAMDLSDGLASDLPRLLPEGLGLCIDANEQISESFLEMCINLSVDPLSAFLSGGEDYLPLLTCPSESSIPDGWQKLGVIEDFPGVVVRHNGQEYKMDQNQGFDHFKKNS